MFREQKDTIHPGKRSKCIVQLLTYISTVDRQTSIYSVNFFCLYTEKVRQANRLLFTFSLEKQ